MKINKIIYIFFIMITIVFLTGCKKNESTSDSEYFIKLLNDVSSGKIEKACIIDLRTLQNHPNNDDYSTEHIKGSLSYDYNKNNKDKFITWISGLYSKKTTILLVDSGLKEYLVISQYLKDAGYKKIISYTDGYQSLKQNEKFKIIEKSTGIDDCGC